MTLCTIECTSIPDGFLDSDHAKLRLSVLLRPKVLDPSAPQASPTVDIAQWPTQVPGLSFQVWAGPSKLDLKPLVTVPANFAFEDEHTPSISPHSQAWWNKLWQNPDDLDGYLLLLNGGGSTVRTGPDVQVKGYDYSRLHQGAIDSALREFYRTFASYTAREKGVDLTQEFLGLTLRAARDPSDPMVRMARLLHSSALSSNAPMPGASGGAVSVQPRPPGMAQRATLGQDFARALDPQTSDFSIWADGGGAFVAGVQSAPSAEQNDHDFEQAMRTDQELKDEAGADIDKLDEKLEYAHQVIGTLQAHPALRKFARQIADIQIEAAALRATFPIASTDLRGVIAVEVVAPNAVAPVAPSPEALFTAFELRTDMNALFEPCPEDHFKGIAASSQGVGAALPLKDGFVEPKEFQGTRRFQIASIDGIAAYYSRKRSNEATRNAYLRGALFEDTPTEPTGFRTRGLMLLDLAVHEMAKQAEKRQAAIVVERLLFAEDLIDGYRVDVVAPNGAVFPACARKVDYHALDVLEEHLRQAYRPERNDGFISPLARTWTVPSNVVGQPADRVLSVSQVVFTWAGRPLGLPSGEIAEAQMATGAHHDLGADYAFDRSRQGPILRQFGYYRFMLRARKLNGSSVPSSSARVGDFALGSQDDKLGRLLGAARSQRDPGYQFGFVEKAPAPTLLVPDAFVGGMGVDSADRENVSRVIVATGSTDAKIRWLVSPIVGFDLAEMQGQFDYPVSAAKVDRDKAAARAQFGAYRYLAHSPENGSFPLIMDGTAAVALVMRTTRPPTVPPGTPYFVDGTLRTIGARLKADKATPPQAIAISTLTTDPAFFPPPAPPGLDQELVVPIRLEVRALGPGGTSRIRNGPPFALRVPGSPESPGRTVSCPTICVDVAPADSLKLELWSNRTPEAFQANPMIAAATEGAKTNALGIGALLEPGARSSYDRYSSLVRNQRVASLSDFATIQIEHPVVQPLRQPSVATSLRAFRAFDAAEWKKIVARGNGEDQVDANKVYAAGRIRVDRKSTGEVWAEAFWMEVASKGRIFRTSKAEALGRVEQVDLFERKTPIQFRRLFAISTLELPEVGQNESAADYLRRINEVDLLLLDQPPPPADGQQPARRPRSLTADFDCDQHRTLAVRLVARSRFAPPDKPPLQPSSSGNAPAPHTQSISELGDQPEDTTYLKQSATRDACRDAIERGNWTGGVIPIRIPATRRPPAPYITNDKGTLYQRVLRASSDSTETELVHVYRCWLDGDWFASGEGEKLAILCRRPSAPTLPDWADAQVSRWGGDSASVPGQKLWMQNGLSEGDATYLLADQIGGVRPDQAVLWKDESSPSVTALVDLACIEPQFHTGYGRWYCDVELKPTGAYKAAVKLVLARFQKHALAGRNLSATVPIDAVMMHQPWKFSAKRMGSNIEVTVTGPGYRGRAPMLEKMDGISQGQTMNVLSDLIGDTRALAMDELPQAPLIIAELERLDSRGTGPMPVLNGGLAVVATSLGVRPQRVPETVESFSQPVMMSRWTLSLRIPSEDVSKPLAIRISLASAHANSQARHLSQAGVGEARDRAGFQPSALDGELIYLPEPIVVQIPVANR